MHNSMDIVSTVESFYKSYAGKKEIIGYTACKQPIYAFYIGEKTAAIKVLAQYGMHAREWITTLLGLYHIERGIQNGYAVIVPLVNPDGVALATQGEAFLKKLPQDRQNFLVQANAGSMDFSLWKANANAVDINVNFDADWGEGKENLKYPFFENYIGTQPNSEEETRALMVLTKLFAPYATLSYHSKGEEIYWYYKQTGEAYKQAKAFANHLATATGYTAKKIFGSSGGYKDWCILKEELLALTIEIGQDNWKHPITEKYLPELIQTNGDSIQDAVDFLNTLR